MNVKRVDKIPNQEERVLFPTTKAEPSYEQSEEAHLEERKKNIRRDGKELEIKE